MRSRTFMIFASITIITAVFAHFATLRAFPRVITATAFERIQENGLALNTFSIPQPITPQNQVVVRSSPDLSYSACIMDLEMGDVEIRVPRVSGYGSLSVFDDRVNNVFVTDLGGAGDDVSIILTNRRDSNGNTIRINGTKAFALVRLIAANETDFGHARSKAQQSTCALLP